jgi:drug/metabolite transporter (DMT)-like permease
MVVVLALALTIAGCVCLYLASPNQKWLAQAPPGKALLVAGGVLLAAGLAAWIAALRPLPGFFVTLHVAMVCLFVFPYSAALRSFGRKN